MFQALKNLLARGRVPRGPDQLELCHDERSDAPALAEKSGFRELPSRDGNELLQQLRARGLKSITSLTLTKNARVMVSFRGREMRIHEGYLNAAPEVLDAIVRLVEGRTKAIRREAGKFVVARAPKTPQGDNPRRRERTHPDDVAASQRLVLEHRRLNAIHFAGALGEIEVRVSRRMKSRLGHYSPKIGEMPAEIAISRRHIRRHGWDDALETLLHEMVHQWQAESGLPLDHGRNFRRKAREVGIAAAAKRSVS